jgi:transposase-like protein
MPNGIYGRESTILNNKIIKLANDGMTTQQIADAVGMTRGATSGAA